MTGAWYSTGEVSHVHHWQDREIPEHDPRAGDHYWIVCPTYHVNPQAWQPGHVPILDMENLMIVAGPMCFYCEQPFSERLSRRRCPGEPK